MRKDLSYTRLVPARADDNDAERFARIEALLEEYRVKHEDLEAYLRWIRGEAERSRTQSRQALAKARRFKRNSTKR